MTRRILILAAIAPFVGFVGCATQGSVDDTKTLNEALELWATLFNRHDSKALALEYSEDADMMDSTGERYQGRAAIQRGFAELFSKNPEIRIEFSDVSRTFLTPDILIEDGRWEESGHRETGLPKQGLYTAVIVKQNEKWLVVHDRGFVPVRRPGER